MRLEVESASAARTTRRQGVLHRLQTVLRGIVGAPDYPAYLEHCRRAGHPPQLTEREYVTEFFQSSGRGRCC